MGDSVCTRAHLYVHLSDSTCSSKLNPLLRRLTLRHIPHESQHSRLTHITTHSMSRWMQTRTYHVLHTGGFLRLATERGRVYWVAQNMTSHSTPDWVSHLSCLTGY
jgi:hypothetical protein